MAVPCFRDEKMPRKQEANQGKNSQKGTRASSDKSCMDKFIRVDV